MAECCQDQDQDHRYHRHRLSTYRPSSSSSRERPADDDDDDEDPVHVPTSAAAAAAHLFGGSFQFIVQEQAKSMVAIQELQQEVGSLLLFRQAVLAALPHLQSSSTTTTSVAAGLKGVARSGQSWTRRKQHLQQLAGYRSLQDGDQPPATTITTTTTTTTTSNASGGVVDSGFSTEASNSNTSPRSSRFDTSASNTSAELTMPHPPMEKELVQHLERVQQRLARLKKDEDRLLTLLNPTKRMLTTTSTKTTTDGDELWLLLEEIEMRSQAIRSNSGNVKDDKPEETVQPMSHKKRVSFQQQQQQLANDTDTGNAARTTTVVEAAAAAAAALPAPPASESSSRYQPPTRDQVAAILRLTNPVQLQRHLLRALLDNQSLREQVEAGRTDVASRDAQWRTNSQLAVEQMTALRDENEDLRFQLEEQKIELEGTKARLRMLSRTPTPTLTPTPPVRTAPALTSIRVRVASTQTDTRPMSTTTLMNKIPPLKIHNQSTQTVESSEDNNNKTMTTTRPLPRVVDASPKPKLSKLVDLASASAGRGSGSWAADEEDRPSVERRSYSSRIPTPIKPTVIPVTVTTPVNNNNINKMQQQTPTSKRELPDIPVKTKTAVLLTPQLSKNHLRGGFVGSKSDPAAKVRVTVVTAGSSPHQRVRTRLSLADSLSMSSEEQQTTHPHDGSGSKVDDYYDSINANHSPLNLRMNKNQQSPYLTQSPLDSLERSLPSTDIQFPFRRIVQTPQPCGGSYNSQSSADNSSTTPSNSLSLQP